ncbi:MAG: HAD family hydrolase [Planctomycetota bacterium]|nr:MAG: HAD family hydrolase [Planctomycetota bacterium]
MRARILFLDVGNTLVRERTSRHELYAACARAHGLDVDAARARAAMVAAHRALPLVVDGAYRYGDAWFRSFIERVFCVDFGLPRGELAAVQDELFATFEDPATFELAAGARELVAALHARGLRTGIVSNWSARLPRLLDRLGFGACFEPLVCSALVGFEKPDPRIFALALERANVGAGEALHAGDDERNDSAAAHSGIHAILVGPPNGSAQPSTPRSGGPRGAPVARVDDLNALRAYILALR